MEVDSNLNFWRFLNRIQPRLQGLIVALFAATRISQTHPHVLHPRRLNSMYSENLIPWGIRKARGFEFFKKKYFNN